jgi:hypothetical protein
MAASDRQTRGLENTGRLVFSSDPEIALIKITRDRHSRYQPYDPHATLSHFEF